MTPKKTHEETDWEELTIPLPTAQLATKKWRDLCTFLQSRPDIVTIDGVLSTSFEVPIDDFKKVIEEVEAVHSNSARAYIGFAIDETGGPQRLKLFFVGIDANGRDMTPSGSPTQGFIYDISHPCPPTCDYNSPLMKDPDAKK